MSSTAKLVKTVFNSVGIANLESHLAAIVEPSLRLVNVKLMLPNVGSTVLAVT
jgi:hypothetical protein